MNNVVNGSIIIYLFLEEFTRALYNMSEKIKNNSLF